LVQQLKKTKWWNSNDERVFSKLGELVKHALTEHPLLTIPLTNLLVESLPDEAATKPLAQFWTLLDVVVEFLATDDPLAWQWWQEREPGQKFGPLLQCFVDASGKLDAASSRFAPKLTTFFSERISKIDATTFETVGPWWYTMVSQVIRSKAHDSLTRGLCQSLLQLLLGISYSDHTIDDRLSRVDKVLHTLIDRISPVAPAEVLKFLVQVEPSFLHQAFSSTTLADFWECEPDAAGAVGRFLGAVQLEERLVVLQKNWSTMSGPNSERRFAMSIQPFRDAMQHLLSQLISHAPAEAWWGDGATWWFGLCNCLIGHSSIEVLEKRAGLAECIRLLRSLPWSSMSSVDELVIDFRMLARISQFILNTLAEVAPDEALSFIIEPKGSWINSLFCEIEVEMFWSGGPDLLTSLLDIVKIEAWLDEYFRRFQSSTFKTKDEMNQARSDFFARADTLTGSFSALLCRLINGAPPCAWWRDEPDICSNWFRLCDIILNSQIGPELRRDVYSCLLELLLDQPILPSLSTAEMLMRLKSVLDFIAKDHTDDKSMSMRRSSEDALISFSVNFIEKMCESLSEEPSRFWTSGPAALGELFDVKIVSRFTALFPPPTSGAAAKPGPPGAIPPGAAHGASASASAAVPPPPPKSPAPTADEAARAKVGRIVDSLLERLLSAVPSSEWWDTAKHQHFCKVFQYLKDNNALRILCKPQVRLRLIPLQKAGKEAYFVSTEQGQPTNQIFLRPEVSEEIEPLFRTDPPVLFIMHEAVDGYLRKSDILKGLQESEQMIVTQLSREQMLEEILKVHDARTEVVENRQLKNSLDEMAMSCENKDRQVQELRIAMSTVEQDKERVNQEKRTAERQARDAVKERDVALQNAQNDRTQRERIEHEKESLEQENMRLRELLEMAGGAAAFEGIAQGDGGGVVGGAGGGIHDGWNGGGGAGAHVAGGGGGGGHGDFIGNDGGGVHVGWDGGGGAGAHIVGGGGGGAHGGWDGGGGAHHAGGGGGHHGGPVQHGPFAAAANDGGWGDGGGHGDGLNGAHGNVGNDEAQRLATARANQQRRRINQRRAAAAAEQEKKTNLRRLHARAQLASVRRGQTDIFLDGTARLGSVFEGKNAKIVGNNVDLLQTILAFL
jgi:hypothetical protein